MTSPEARQQDTMHDWLERLSAFLPPFYEEHQPLAAYANRASVLLHGSLTMGNGPSMGERAQQKRD